MAEFESLIEHRILFLRDEIDAETATTLISQFLLLEKQDPKEEITLYINSPGGTVQDGLLAIYDIMQSISCPISTICIGEACSAAAVILASGNVKRRMALPHASIMIHTIQASDISGSTKEVENESKSLKKINRSLMEILARHTGQSLSKVLRDCKTDKWMTAQEALKYGIIDFILCPVKKIPNLKPRKSIEVKND